MITKLLNYIEEIDPKDLDSTTRWYREAKKYCRELSNQTGLPITNTVAIVSALSPSVAWDINMRDAANFIKSNGSATVSTYGQQKRKASKLLNTTLTKKEMLEVLGGDKTKSFFLNILHPMTSGPVTLDRHALKAVGINPEGYIKVRDRKGAKKAYREAAELVGLRPHELQAVVWEHVRKEGY